MGYSDVPSVLRIREATNDLRSLFVESLSIAPGETLIKAPADDLCYGNPFTFGG